MFAFKGTLTAAAGSVHFIFGMKFCFVSVSCRGGGDRKTEPRFSHRYTISGAYVGQTGYRNRASCLISLFNSQLFYCREDERVLPKEQKQGDTEGGQAQL